jgi:hypothetical protein
VEIDRSGERAKAEADFGSREERSGSSQWKRDA